ncbi:MAG: hypothetical protein M3O70_17680, partial [Actinomycetota bacterium]|nr:hypothetical protein [Actinomycetota bacterium]
HKSLGMGSLWRALWESPIAFLLIVLTLGLMAAMVRFAHDARGPTRLLLGVGHSSLQLAGLTGVMIAASRLSSAAGLQAPWSLVSFLALIALLGGIGGTLGVSGYLWATNSLGFHGNEAYAPLHHADLKNFLRVHIDTNGALNMYPIGVDRVGRHWQICPDASAHAPWFAPSGPEPEAHLIERPVKIDE